MKVRYLKLKNWLLVTLMGVLGFSSCRSHKQAVEAVSAEEKEVEERAEMRLMYGVPTMDYRIRGQVKDAQGKPVVNIRVNMLERGIEVKDGELQGDPARVKRWLESSAAVTDRNGRFNIENSGLPLEEVRLLVRDVDGAENGDFKDQLLQMKVEASDVDRTNARGWNQGTYSKDVDVKLEAK